ncbi:MAG: tRNA lysidine(34) synthetase TilS [Clostridia bacterium]|nr:tRNA lysidine(34) synthetase TilS [Clostridia bacterium]
MMKHLKELPQYAKFVSCVEEHHLLSDQDNVIVAVSGGADSVALLCLLLAYMSPARILVAHVNHGIRGDEAFRDAQFVQDLCADLQLDFQLKEVDVPTIAQEAGLGLEECGRLERYRFLETLAKERNAVIAVAHHREDRAETILMNIARGCGIDGLKGISYRHGNIVRPLMDFDKKELLDVCTAANIVPMVDGTNFEDCTLRNRVRHTVLPYLTEAFGRNMTDKLIDLSEHACMDSAFIDEYAADVFERVVEKERYLWVVDRTAFYQQPDAIQYRILRRVIASVQNAEQEFLYPEGKDLTAEMIRRVRAHLLQGKSGKIVEIGKKIQCQIEGNRGVIYYCTEFDPEDCVKCPEIEIYALDQSQPFDFESNQPIHCAYFDFDALYAKTEGILERIEMRRIRTGDNFTPYGMTGHMRLRKFLIDHKIPLSRRKILWVVAIGNEILWIPGIRRSNIGPITNTTKNIIKIKVKMEDIYDGE